MKGFTRTALTACLAVASVGLGACGGSGGGASSSGGGGSGEPIKIGADVPLTGPLAGNGQDLKKAYQLGIDEINAKGGINGRKVQLTVEDDKGDPAVATNVVRKLATSDRVDAILGSYGSEPALASSAVAEQYKIPNVQPFASAPEMVTRGFKYLFNTFRLSSNIEVETDKFVNAVVKPKTAAVIYIDNPFAIAGAKTITQGLQRAGVNIVVNQKIASGESNYTSVISKVKAAKPDALMMVIYLPDDLVIMKELKQFNVAPKFVYVESSIHFEPAVKQALGEAADWVVASPDWFPGAPNEQAKSLVKRYNARYHEDPTIETMKGYQAEQILFDAIKRAGSTDKDKVRDALAATDLDTVGGHVTFESNGQADIPTMIAQLQNLKPVAVWPPDIKQADWKPMPAWSSR